MFFKHVTPGTNKVDKMTLKTAGRDKAAME